MNFKSIFKKRNYQYVWYVFSPFFPKVKNRQSVNRFETLEHVIKDFFKDVQFDHLVVVASGPSARKLELSNSDFYACTNNSITIVKKYRFFYFIQDKFIVLRYLKRFFNAPYWKGTFCIVNDNGYKGNKDVHELVSKYLKRYQRTEKEYLISDINHEEPFSSYYEEIKKFLKSEFDFEFVTLNSGFSLLLLSTYIAKVLNKPMKIYGLDYGEGGNEYFDGGKIDEHCSYADANKNIMGEFCRKLYRNENFSVENHSFFESNV